ncbi:MAG: ADP-ribosylglycohydrolase family protein, partial [bacterium]
MTWVRALDQAMGMGHYSDEEWQELQPWASRSIPVPPTSPDRVRTRDQVRGMLLGLAIGDSLGNTTEGMTPDRRRRAHGEIRDYLPSRWSDMTPMGVPSDDTQLSFWTAESLLRRGYLDAADLAHTFTRRDRIFGIGSAMTAFLFAYRFGGRQWFEAGQPSAGNGALMRMAPVLLPHLRSMTKALWVDVAVATILTHKDEAAMAASVGVVGLLAECLARSANETPLGAPPARWWPETFLHYARPAETAGVAGGDYGSRVPGDPFHGSLCDRVEQELFPAIDAGESVLAAADRWYSGAYLLETVPCVLHILALHGSDPEEAIVRAVNDTKDNDTVAAIVGAAVGALHGEAALP